jgi:hypothetical protein
MKIDVAGTFGVVHLETLSGAGREAVEISTENWPECDQSATMTLDEFTRFIEKCQEIEAKMRADVLRDE